MKKLLYLSLLLASLAVPAFIFEFLFISELGDLTQIMPAPYYRDAPVFFVATSFLLAILFSLAAPRFYNALWYKIASIIVYLGAYTLMCFWVALDVAAAGGFGNTWHYNEIFPELLAPHWYFYVFGILGLVMHFFMQHLIIKK